MIADFYKTTFNVIRQQWTTETQDGEEINYSAEQVVSSFLGYVQQASAQLAVSIGLEVTKAFTLWCPPNTDILDGDIIDGCGKRYTVKGVQINGDGKNRHKEVMIEWLGKSLTQDS